MPAVRKPDPARSYALIIGASEYDDRGYQRHEAIRASADRFASLISSEAMWNLPVGNVKSLTGRVTVREAAVAIEEAAGRPGTDGLFIYLCTHGRRWTEDHVPDRDLHFALSDSAWSWPFTHLPLQWARHTLKRRTAASTLLIIDSCFSDVSMLGSGSPPPPARVSGACVLTATRERVLADTTWPGTDFTAFSGALIEIIGDGIEDAGEYLTPDTIFDTLREKLAPAHPEPGITKDHISVFLCPNNAYQRVTNEAPLNELLTKLDEIESVDPAVYATAIEDTSRGADQPAVTTRLIDQFGAKRSADETIKLADLLRSQSVPALGDHADGVIERFYASRDGAAITHLLHRLHRQDVDAIDAGEVLRKLKKNEQAAEVTADVCAGLRDTDCPDCNVISSQLFASLPDEWHGPEELELLRVLH